MTSQSIYKCKFCVRICKNPNSKRSHENLCKENPNHRTTPFQNMEFQKNKNSGNQYTKAKELGLPKPITTEETRSKISERNKLRSKEWNIANGAKISKTINEKVKNGNWHTSLAKHMHIEYNGVDLHGTWELKYAQHLDANKVKWVRNKDSFAYVYDNVERRYTPDFYLTDGDEYVEIKGYKTEKDDGRR